MKLFFAQLFRLISSVYTEQSQICVKNVKPAMQEWGRLVLEGQSDQLLVPSVMKTNTPLTDDPAQEEDLMQKYQERVEKLSQQDLKRPIVYEDNEAVIKMILKGRSPTVRHVPRTHRVALDWLFNRIHLDPKKQVRYIDTTHQLADMLTKRKFHT